MPGGPYDAMKRTTLTDARQSVSAPDRAVSSIATQAALTMYTSGDGPPREVIQLQTRLSRDVFVQTALALVDDEGLESVTTRRLAEFHGVTPMALYRYFNDKDAIFDALAERVLSDVSIPDADERPWHDQANDLLEAFVAALRAHPDAAILVLTRILWSDPGIAVTDRMLSLLIAAGFAVDAAAETASQALCSLVSVVVAEPGRASGNDVDAHDAAIRLQKVTLSALDPRRYPHVVAAADALTRCVDTERYYRRSVSTIVAGLRASKAIPDDIARQPRKSTGTTAAPRTRRSTATRSR
jgi:TetR/AcrR family tetracycline transcriptional repressor